MEKTGNGYLENELEIKTSPKFSLTTINDSLKLFEVHSNLGCTAVFVLLLSAILFFIDKVTLMVFFLTLMISAVGYLWRYKYTFKKKPVIIINHVGLKEKDHQYLWAEMLDLTCSEEFDNERAMFTATHLRFIYHGEVKKIYIGGYDKSIEEIIHYVAMLKCK
ncbi:hypothetical protein [Pedobacter soli]|uniref:Uncharacterized protein n=1 Tax=Pedobacter soli TaxID=390242 RepID=A0A1G6UQ22_9SPHI|nr:hypothetical protein [Pedobacter soli]SDD43530.1 hypothetical protein SAMN04488024_105418 [Pedobacter soli]